MLRPLLVIAFVLLAAATATASELPRLGGMYQQAGQALPMLDSKVEVTVRGPIIEVIVTQHFANRADRATGHALRDAGYVYYMSERKIFFCDLPLVRSDFYGRSPQYVATAEPAVVSLHATWEVDVRRTGDRGSLRRLIDALVRQKERARAAAQRLAEELFTA